MDPSRSHEGDSGQDYSDLASTQQVGIIPDSPNRVQLEGWKGKSVLASDLLPSQALWPIALGLAGIVMASTFALRRRYPAATLRRARITIGCGSAFVVLRVASKDQFDAAMHKAAADPHLSFIWDVGWSLCDAGPTVYKGNASLSEQKAGRRRINDGYKEVRKSILEDEGLCDRIYAAVTAAMSPLSSRAEHLLIMIANVTSSGIRPSPHDVLVGSTLLATLTYWDTLDPLRLGSAMTCWAALGAECIVRNSSILRYTGRLGIAALIINSLVDPLFTHITVRYAMRLQDPKALADLLRYIYQPVNK